jgi:hypothetical protein
MTERRFPSQPEELLRRLGGQVVPVDAPARVEQRREQVVAALARSIRENAERKRRATYQRWVWAVGLAASLALGIGVAARVRHAHDSASHETTVADVRGAVVVTEGGESRVLSHGGTLALRAVGEIETAFEAQAELRSEKSVVHIGPATKLTVPPVSNVEERYRLSLGRVDVSVDKESRLTRSVVVETPHAEVVVHGTVFAVGVSSRSERLVTEVSVTRGSVWVLANGVQVALLGPGQRWSSDSLAAPPPPNAPSSAPSSEGRGVSDVIAPVDSATRRDAPRVPRREATSAELKASTLAEQSHQFQDAIDARNRGDDARAVELFARLLARYPAYEEAEVQLFRAQKRLGRASQ